MEQEKFNEILNFAIDREKEAVEFYEALREKAKFSGMKEFLLELADMERGHITMLEILKKKDVSHFDVPEVENLKVSEYLVVDESPLENMDYANILANVIKKEENSYKLYTTLANNFSDSEIKNIFEKLASEELKHKNKFEKLYDEDVLKDN